MKIIDAHTHVYHADEGSPALYDVAEQNQIAMNSVLSLACTGDLTQNIACAVCKLTHPGMTYAFAGLEYVSGRDYLEQVKHCVALGFDGMKMLEAKPTTRKDLNIRLDDACYDAYFSHLEETRFPVLFHVADPPEFWDAEKAPDWAVAAGWVYDGSYPPYSQFYEEVDNVLRKHPKLHAIFAHFYFLSGDPDAAQRFLDEHPNVSLDLTAGVEMYVNFSKDPEFWRGFLTKNADRIIYGTDSTDEPLGETGSLLDSYAGAELRCLRTSDEFDHFQYSFRGLALPEEALEQILHANYEKYVDPIPRKMDIPGLIEEADYLIRYISDTAQVRTMEKMRGILSGILSQA